jgi:O-acetyl-ADP-ribose deacetylase (regulator of RNase III)/tRNA A-37 threonylcarbamoyl transferase component Bud32
VTPGSYAGGMTLGGRVRDYEVWGRLGEGGMSEVWLAKHRVLCAPVVMKTLRHRALGLDVASCTKRVFEEARLLSRVTSPHVVRAVDAGVHDDADQTAYLVEEYVDGIDLAELDRRRRRALGVGLPLWFVCHVMQELGNGLRAAHQVGVLHRDMKPSNAFAAPGSGGIRLGDFGLAVARADAPPGDVSGTLRFMAPEQLRGENVGRFTDVYGAGATAYDLRYGSPPFVDTRSALDDDARPRFPPAHSPAEAYFQNVLARMLAKRVDERPRDIGEPTSHFRALVNALSPMRARVRYVPGTRDSFTLGEVAVTLKNSDIADSKADAVVSSANDELRMRSGTGEALRLRGGDAIEEEAMAGGRQPLGTCIATGAGALGARHVIHAVSAWNEASCIGRAMCRVLLLADELGHRSLAIPALGTGAAHVNIETCARAMSSALVWHLALGGSRLRRVDFVLQGEAKLSVFREVLEDVLGDGLDAPFGDLGMPVEDSPVYAEAATHLDARSRH